MAFVNQQAFELRTRIADLASATKQLSVLAGNAVGDLDARIEAAGELDDLGSRLQHLHDDLGDLFIDAARDSKDQRFALLIRQERCDEHFSPDHIHTTPDGRHFRHGDGAEVDSDGNLVSE